MPDLEPKEEKVPNEEPKLDPEIEISPTASSKIEAEAEVPETLPAKGKNSKGLKIIAIAALIFGLVALGGLVYLYLNTTSFSNQVTKVLQKNLSDLEELKNKTSGLESRVSEIKAEEGVVKQKDLDEKLKDYVKKEDFVNLENVFKEVDTDRDGLSDYDEVITYKSDPNKKDSDGDGYTDKEEVDAGYDPTGSGKL